MSWTRPDDLRRQLQKLWDRGNLLAPLVTGEVTFPRRLLLHGPTSSEVTHRFNEVRSWITALRSTANCRIEMREFTHQVFGSNSVPQAVWIDSLDDALAMIGKKREAVRFRAILDLTRQRQPVLLGWLAQRPLRSLGLVDQWQRLLDIVTWLQQHPRPGIYLRQVDIPGVHSKFIESHRGVLAELLNLAMPAETIEAGCTGLGQFAARFGFRDKPARIRLRMLAAEPALLPVIGQADMTLDADSFARLEVPVRQVFITENETNFLAFPPVAASAVIFGAGYGWDALARAQWLQGCTIHYWGDIDTHGFAILDQLRSRLANVDSFLMDRKTLMAHEAYWGQEDNQVLHDLPRLTTPEQALFDDLRDNRIRKGLRLEQEMVGFRWLECALPQ